MNKILIAGFIVIYCIVFPITMHAQDITNKLGGTASTDEFKVTDSGDNVLFEVQGDGKVGIGTTSPDNTLHVHTATAGNVTAHTSGDNLVVEDSIGCGISILKPDDKWGYIMFGSPADNNDAEIYHNYNSGILSFVIRKAGSEMSFQIAGSEAMRMNSSGYVGIGTTSPTTLLNLGSATAGGRDLGWGAYGAVGTMKSSGNTFIASAVKSSSTTNSGLESSYGVGPLQRNGIVITNATGSGDDGLYFFTSPATTIAEGTTFGWKANTKMVIGSNGNVGIGTTSPSQKLTVAGTIESTTGGFKFPDGTTQTTAAAGGVNGSGSSGQVSFWTGSSSLSGDNGLFWDNTNKRLGIGTTSPGARLDIKESTAGNWIIRALEGASAEKVFGIYEHNTVHDGVLTLYDGSNTAGIALRGNGNSYLMGNIGIGTTSPGQKLTVVGTIESTSGGFKFPDGTTQTTAAAGGVNGSGSSGQVSFWTGSSSLSGDNGLFWDNTNKRLGIGTTSPSYTLDVNGNISISSSPSSHLFMKDTGGALRTVLSALTYDSIKDRLKLGGGEWEELYFENAGGSPAMMISEGGNVGIGTASPGALLDVRGDAVFNEAGADKDFRIEGDTNANLFFVDASADKVGIGTSTPSQQLDVVGYASANRFVDRDNASYYVEPASSSYFNGVYANTFYDKGNTSYYLDPASSSILSYVGFGGPVSGGYRIYVYGNAYATGNWYYGSDIRWKKNIISISDALNKVLNLKGVKFNWNKADYPELNFSEGTQIGFIAQEVEPIIPEVVHTDSEGYKSISYHNLTALLVEGIKDQQNIIDQQRSELDQAKEDLNEIKSKMMKIELALQKLDVLTANQRENGENGIITKVALIEVN